MNARDHALLLLDRTRLPHWQANLIRRNVETPTDLRDLALSEQIRVGVIKNHALLEHLIQHYASRPDRLDPIVRKILAVGLYQLRFLTRIPSSAAVNEAVEQVRRFGRPHSAGFVNAILRRATREPDVPLPERGSDPRGYASVALSHPVELVDRLIAQLGVEQAIQFCEHDNSEPPTIVRAMRGGKFPPDEPGDLKIQPHEQAGMYVVEGARRADLAAWAAAGAAQVQDPTAAGVVEHLGVEPGNDVLDRCAGLGTKTLQIHEQLEPGRGWIMAVDPSAERCEGLRKLITRRGINNVAVVQTSMLRKIPQIKRPGFDRIIIDAPCSNSGVMARRPEARYAQTPSAMDSLAKLQDDILSDTADYLRSGGTLIYSTCSIWPEENEQRTERFLAAHPEYTLVDSRSTLPSLTPDPLKYRDGGYFAVMKRR